MARPTDAVIAQERDTLAAMVAARPDGVSAAELRQEYTSAYPDSPRLTQRTILRRLEDLEAERRIRAEGGRRWRRYRPIAVGELRPAGTGTGVNRPAGAHTEATHRTEEENPTAGPLPPEGEIPLSKEGEEIRTLVRRPPEEKPAIIPYDEALLRSYTPGTTWYLSEATRAGLHEAGRTPVSDRPAGTYARHIYERLLIDLSWASSRLEGNQYTRIDTKNLIERNITAKKKTAKDTQMILNHRKAIELLVDRAEEVGYNRYTFCNLHAALSENLLPNPEDEGRLRTHIVGIDGSPFHPLGIPQKIEELFDYLLKTVARIPDPFEQAFFLMVHLPYLQPFADVNKRTSRLAANIPLIKGNLTPLSFVGTSEQAYTEGTLGVYEERRVEMLRDVFVALYERSSERYQAVRRDMVEPDPVRLAYREQLHALVSEYVAEARVPDAYGVSDWALQHGIPAGDATAFTEIAIELLDSLHEGSISRYGLRPSQFAAWHARMDDAAHDEPGT
jgi:Fic family protein